MGRKIRKERASSIFLGALSPYSCLASPARSRSRRAGCCHRWTGAVTARRSGFRWAFWYKLLELLRRHRCEELEAILLQTPGAECLDLAFRGSAQNPSIAAPRWLFPYWYRSHVLGKHSNNHARKYGLWGSLWDNMGTLRPTSKVAKGQVQAPVPKLPFSLLWRFCKEQLLQPSSLITPPQPIVCLQEVN